MSDATSRVQRMIAYLSAHADEIERWQFGHVRFDWGGRWLKAHRSQSEELTRHEGDERLSA